MQTPLSELKLPLKLKWKRGKDLLQTETYKRPQVAVLKEKVYIGGGCSSSDKVIVYDPQQDSCETLPPYSCKFFAMAVVNDQLVLVGGEDGLPNKPGERVTHGLPTNRLGVWNGQWTHPLPPMITARCMPLVVTHKNRWLVVMGGIGFAHNHDYYRDGGVELSHVEILDVSEPSQWYHAAQLPHVNNQHALLPVTIGNMCYLYSLGDDSEKVSSVCLDSLITQAVSQPYPWQTLPKSPVDEYPNESAGLVAFNGALLAVGGSGYADNQDIYQYQPSSKSWIKAGELPTERRGWDRICTVLPSGEVFVADIQRQSSGAAIRVDIATIQN